MAYNLRSSLDRFTHQTNAAMSWSLEPTWSHLGSAASFTQKPGKRLGTTNFQPSRGAEGRQSGNTGFRRGFQPVPSSRNSFSDASQIPSTSGFNSYSMPIVELSSWSLTYTQHFTGSFDGENTAYVLSYLLILRRKMLDIKRIHARLIPHQVYWGISLVALLRFANLQNGHEDQWGKRLSSASRKNWKRGNYDHV